MSTPQVPKGWKINTALFLTSQALSLFGTMLVQYAIMWHIVLKTQSGFMMMLYIIAGVLPTFFTSLAGGVWADRYNKKLLINAADGSIAAISLVIAIALHTGLDSIILLLVAAAVRALGQGVQQPAVMSLIPLIVPEEKLLKINGFNSSIQSGIFILSPIASASLMSIAPLETLFLIDVVTAGIAITILYFLVKVPFAGTKNDESTSHFTELLDGIKYIKSQKYLSQYIFISAIYMIAMSPVSFLSPLQVTRNFPHDTIFASDLWRLTAIEVGFAVGMISGGILVGVWCFHNKMYAIGMANAVFGILTISFGLWTSFIPYLVCMFICGVFCAYYHAPSMTLLQEKVPPEYLGRVMSVFTILGSIGMPFGMLFFGPMADIVNINYLFIGSGIVMLYLGTLFFTSKTLRQADA